MFARTSTFHGDPSGISGAFNFVRDEVMPALADVPGWVGLSMMIDRPTGECITTTSWNDVDAMRASSDRLTKFRDRVGGILNAPPAVQEWQVAVMRRADPAHTDRWCRVTWLKAADGNLDRGVEIYRTGLLPRIEQLPGFCSASLMVDRARGRVCSTASFKTLESLQLSREEALMIREAGIREADVDIMDAAEYELAIAHLRVPELA
ncbi:hypothetical protein SFC88_15385 [Nocardioides sp. HM23]|uniref:hypothetical protein n=1 Tax=Nocardioides bizhenqiangii TaxID=3095076 RepID=UPI002ACA00D5|nr:hypothetical protein [Nocardioides sp. HM23]MDZ5622227.1 hypothetical protein [Nocardioides sp. HM23]